MIKVLFIDRDGTLVIEPPVDYQLDSLEKLEFYPKVFQYLSKIYNELDYEFVMVTNQDGLGTPFFPEGNFWPVQNKIIKAFDNEEILFSEIIIDKTFPHENAPTRKPRTGLLTKYINNDQYDIKNSLVIGDRLTDIELAKNLGCRAILLTQKSNIIPDNLLDTLILKTKSWSDIYTFLTKK